MVFSSTYANFRATGPHSGGEMHGGATLEEMLVPVIVLRVYPHAATSVSVEVVSSPVYLDPSGCGELLLRFRGLHTPVTVGLQGQMIPAIPDHDVLHAQLVNMQAGTYTIAVVDSEGHTYETSVTLVKGAARSVLEF